MNSEVVEVYEKKSKDYFYNKSLNIIHNGEKNLKPLILENIAENSPSTLQCVETYGRFLSGAGFKLESLKDVNLNTNSHEFKNPNDLLSDITDELKIHEGVFINIHYNALYEKTKFKVIPNNLCRLGKKDDNDFSGKIVVSEQGWGRSVKKKDLKLFDNYNPSPLAIEQQVIAAGGWHNYKGQIFYFRLNTKYSYAKSPLETSYIYSDVERNLGLFYSSTVKRKFEDLTIIKHRKFEDNSKKEDFINNVRDVSGLENSSSKLLIETDWDDEVNKDGDVKIDTVKNETKADKYKHFEDSSANMIRKTYQIPPQLVDFVAGKLGNTAGKDIVMAQSIYNTQTEKKRKKISSLFRELFTNYKDEINSLNDWDIKQYKLLPDGTTNE